MLSRLAQTAFAAVLVVASIGRASADDLTVDRARPLAEEAYVYGFGIVEDKKSMFGMQVWK